MADVKAKLMVMRGGVGGGETEIRVTFSGEKKVLSFQYDLGLLPYMVFQ